MASMPVKKGGDQGPSGSGPKRSGGKASKLAKMNEQERARYLEKKLAEEEESKRKKEEMVVAFMKRKMGQEQKFFHVNNSKLVDQWRVILRQCKNQELQNDVKTLAESFARAMERKNAHIAMLMKELNEAEDQYNIAFRSQRELLDSLNEVHRQRLYTLLKQHDDNSSQILNQSAQERQLLEEDQTTQLKYLGDVHIATQQNHDAVTEEIKNVYQEVRDEYRNKNMEEKQAVQINLDEEVENLWLRMQKAINDHRSGTEEKRRMYQELMVKDKKGLAEVVENNKRITKLTEDAQKLRDTLSDMADLEDRRLSHLRRERDMLQARLHDARRSIAIRQTKSGEKEVKRVSLLVDQLQKKIQEIVKFQTKAKSVIDGCNANFALVPYATIPKDELKVITFINEASLQLVSLNQEKRKLKDELQIIRVALKSYLKEVARTCN